MASGLEHDINQNFSFSVSNISQGNAGIHKLNNQHPHSIVLRSLKFGTVNSFPTKIKTYFEDTRYMQMEHDKQLLQEQHHPSVFGVVFQATPGFLSSRVVPIAYSTTSGSSTDSRTVLCQFHAKD